MGVRSPAKWWEAQRVPSPQHFLLSLHIADLGLGESFVSVTHEAVADYLLHLPHPPDSDLSKHRGKGDLVVEFHCNSLICWIRKDKTCVC